MSGGTFNYDQYKLKYLGEELENYDGFDWMPEDEKKAVQQIIPDLARQCEVLFNKIHALDYYLASDIDFKGLMERFRGADELSPVGGRCL